MSGNPLNSNQKGTKDAPRRRSVSRKRKFTGNQHTYEQSTANTSMSAEKLLQSKDENILIDPTHGYCIIQFFSVFYAISNLVMCKTCKKNVTFNQASPRGLGFKIAVMCECGVSYINSGPMIENAFEINRRLVAVMRLLGIGINGINIFCGLMDLATKFYHQTFAGCFTNLWTAAESVCRFSMQRAVEEEKELTLKKENSATNLTVSGDGTWKKRGHTSRFGVVTLAGKYCKKIIDSCVKSTYCQSCVFWKNKKDSDPEAYEEWLSLHDDDCDINHVGSVSKMEVDSVKDMFGRSISKYGVKYSRYIGDGDSTTYKGLLDLNPYDIPVEKLECPDNTQNNNESYNGLLWRFAPEHLHSGFKTIELSNYLATSIFNDGYSSILKMFNVMGVIVGPAARDCAANKDETRLRVAEHRQQGATKEGRSSRRRALTTQQAQYEEDEGELYGPRMAD